MVRAAIAASVAALATATQLSPECQAKADAYCNQGCFPGVASRCDGPMVARHSGPSSAKGGVAWRCYSPSTLTPNEETFESGSCYCSRASELTSIINDCQWPQQLSPAAQAQADAFCAQDCLPKLDSHCDGPMYARHSGSWRCYSPSTLNSDNATYKSGDCFCTRDAQLQGIVDNFQAGSDLDVDLSSDLGPMEHRAAGILHSMSSATPRDELVAPLSLRLFRANANEIAEAAPRLKALGVRQAQVVVSDSYGYDAPWPGDDSSYDKLDRIIEEVVAKVGGVEGIAFDIWNEPNGGPFPEMRTFWQRSKQQFFDTWKHGYQRLRSILPNATIVGPSSNSIAGGDTYAPSGALWMQDFLKFANENNVMPDVISWHELLPSSVEPRHGHILVLEAEGLRAWMSANGIPSRPFSVNEYTPQDANTKPGTTVGFMAALERVGVDSAAHACWNDDSSCGDQFSSNCFSGTLDGLLSCPSREPRASWWAYAAYGNMSGTVARIDRNCDVADGIAAVDESIARILVGTYPTRRQTISLSVLNIPKALQVGSNVFVTIHRISGTGWSALSQPEFVLGQTMTSDNNELKLSLDASPEDAFSIMLSQPTVTLI